MSVSADDHGAARAILARRRRPLIALVVVGKRAGGHRHGDELEAESTAARNAADWHVCLHAMQSVLSGGTMTTPLDWGPAYRGYAEKALPTGAMVPGIHDKN
ncbi:hypothetical protein IEE92_12955 [Kocuria sp. cx-116]|uniref:hypothetical protein n=1 Tax=Kocuria sp. cx-116 TaxID=2771378 RepID=UPI00168594A9|nr:hypothetical protein [Kocuria sp. cx-116]MBD2763450.1 hypothetical protein [Kocuria sp. cx-116]